MLALDESAARKSSLQDDLSRESNLNNVFEEYAYDSADYNNNNSNFYSTIEKHQFESQLEGNADGVDEDQSDSIEREEAEGSSYLGVTEREQLNNELNDAINILNNKKAMNNFDINRN